MKHALALLVYVSTLFVAAAAHADDADVDRAVSRWSSMAVLDVETDLFRLVEEPLVYREGPLKLTITDGIMVPVFSGRFDGEWREGARDFLRSQREAGRPDRVPGRADRGDKAFVGFVLVDAQATAELTLDDRADAQVLANRLVLGGLADADEMRPVAAGEAPMTVSVTSALFFGTDPRLEQMYVGGAFGDADDPDSDVFSVVVYGDREGLRRDLAHARTVFQQRLRIYDRTGLHLPESVAMARSSGEPWADSTRHLAVVDLHTDQRFGLVSAARGNVDVSRDRWVALLRDDTGLIDARRQWSLRSLGMTAGYPVAGLVGGVPLPSSHAEDPTSAPTPASRLEPRKADARVLITPRPSGVLDVDVTVDLTVHARGAAFGALPIRVPAVEAEPNTWELVGVTLPDGRSIVGSQPVVDRRELRQRERDSERDGDESTDDDDDGEVRAPVHPGPEGPTADVWLFFPDGIDAGETVTFQLHYRDTWAFRNWSACMGERPMGDGSGLRSVLPDLPGAAVGSPWPVHMRIGVPEGSNLQVAASGETLSERTEKGWRMLEVANDAPALWPMVSVGRWNRQIDPGKDGLPSVRANLFSRSPASLKSVGQQVRQMVLYYQGWLPQFPVAELDVFEAPSACGGYVWIAPHGMVQLQKMVVDDGPLVGAPVQLTDRFLEEGTLAHEVAHQYWGHLVAPATTEDFWIAETMSEGFSCMYLGKAADPKVCERRMREYRRFWEKEVPGVIKPRASLTGAYASVRQPHIVYRYGPFVTHEMLRRKVGTEAYFKALDGVARLDGPVTTERLQMAMELTSGQELDDFFDFWVYGGFIPEVTLRWWTESGRLRGEVTSDVPFGTFEVPIVVQLGEARSEAWVKVENGRGVLAGPQLPPGAKVRLDPDGRIVARKRRVQKGAP